MGDLRLQFADQPLEDAHLGSAEKAHLFQVKDIARDGLEVFVDAGKSLRAALPWSAD
jgi:hypothetical protein